MRKINLLVTATRTDVDNQFKGTITFENEQNDKVSFEYFCATDKQIDIKFSNKDENFHVKGPPSKELFDGLKDNQKWISALSINLILLTIENSENILSSHNVARLKTMLNADATGKMSDSLEVEEDAYQFVFGNKIAKVRSLLT